MKIKFYNVVCFIAVVVGIYAHPALAAPSEKAAPSQNLKLALAVNPQDGVGLVLGKPVWITATITNIAKVDVIAGYDEWRDSISWLLPSSPSGHVVLRGTPVPGLSYTSTLLSDKSSWALSPNQSYSYAILLNDYVIFNAPDKFDLRCRIELPEAREQNPPDNTPRKMETKAVEASLSLSFARWATSEETKAFADQLEAQLMAKDSDAQYKALRLIYAVLPPETAVPLLQKALISGLQSSRIAAMVYLSRMDQAIAGPVIKQALENPHQDVREMARNYMEVRQQAHPLSYQKE